SIRACRGGTEPATIRITSPAGTAATRCVWQKGPARSGGRESALHLTCGSGYNRLVRGSVVRHLRSPPRVEPNRRDAELAALVANVPGAIYRCALDRNWTMAMISDEIERISGYPPSDYILNRVRSVDSVMHHDDRAAVARETGQ